MKEARIARGVSVKDLALRSGVAPSVIYDIERGEQDSNGRMAVIAEVLGIRGRWLMDGVGPRDIEQTDMFERDFEDRYDRIKYASGAVLSAGPGLVSWEFEEIDKHFAFRREWLKSRGLKADSLTMHSVKGDSMANYIQSGDIVMLDESDRAVKDGEVYGLSMEGELRVKRLFKRPGGILVVSDNQGARDPEFTTEQANLVILGRVVWRGG